MYIPQKDERVLVCPSTPNEAVQRGVNTYGQFLQNGWQEVLFNDFLHNRVLDGSLLVKPIQKQQNIPVTSEKIPTDPITTNETDSNVINLSHLEDLECPR